MMGAFLFLPTDAFPACHHHPPPAGTFCSGRPGRCTCHRSLPFPGFISTAYLHSGVTCLQWEVYLEEATCHHSAISACLECHHHCSAISGPAIPPVSTHTIMMIYVDGYDPTYHLFYIPFHSTTTVTSVSTILRLFCFGDATVITGCHLPLPAYVCSGYLVFYRAAAYT